MSPLFFPPDTPTNVWKVKLDPESLAIGRTGLEINSGSVRVAQGGIDWGQAAISAYQADMQQYGSSMVDFRVPNRIVTIPFGIGIDESDFYVARQELLQKVGTIMREGGIIQRGFDVPLYADVVTATLTMPDQWAETGLIEPNCSLSLECLPDFYGEEVVLDAASVNGAYAAVLLEDGTQASIAGDAPGRCRIVINDGSGLLHDGIIWGFRCRNYSADATKRLIYQAESLTPIPPASIQSEGDADGSVVKVNLTVNTWSELVSTDIVGLGSMEHTGTYKVWARVIGSGADIPWFQLMWSVGGLYAPVINDPVLLPSVGSFFLADLGQVTIPRSRHTPLVWNGLIRALGGPNSPGYAAIDKIWLQPLDDTSGVLEGTQDAGGIPGSHIMYPDQQCEIATDGIMRTDPNGLWGYVPVVLGDLPRIPCSGLENRPVELLVGASQGDIETIPDGPDYLDMQTIQVFYRPSYIFTP